MREMLETDTLVMWCVLGAIVQSLRTVYCAEFDARDTHDSL